MTAASWSCLRPAGKGMQVGLVVSFHGGDPVVEAVTVQPTSRPDLYEFVLR